MSLEHQLDTNDGSKVQHSSSHDPINSLDKHSGHQNLIGADEDDEKFPDDFADDPDFVREVQKILWRGNWPGT